MANNRFSRILLRGGTKQELKDINPMLKEREPIVEYDTGRMKIGDGINRYNELKYVGGGSGGGTPTITSFKVTKCIDSIGNTFTSGNVPNGATITEITLEYMLSSTPDQILVYDANNIYYNENYSDKLANAITITDKQIVSDTDYTLTMKYNDSSISEIAKVSFNSYIYTMTSNESKPSYINNTTTSINYNYLGNLVSKLLTISRSNVLPNINSGTDSYIYIFLPAKLYDTSPIVKAGDFTGGFIQLASEDLESFSKTHTINIINEYDIAEEYYVFRSTNFGLGVKTITIS